MSSTTRTAALLLALVLCGNGTSLARTWYVAADGSGDAPTIAAAVDSSMSGDIILVGPGTHVVVSIVDGGVILKSGTSLVSERGPTVTRLIPGAGPLQPGLLSLSDDCVVTGFTMEGGQLGTLDAGGVNTKTFNNMIGGEVSILGGGEIHHNLIYNGFPAVRVNGATGIRIYNNIILGDVTSDIFGCGAAVVTCNLVQGQQDCFFDEYANFNADPLFCGVGNYYLRADSPCAPGNHPDGVDCGLIGPLPVGCGTVRGQPTTWGTVKVLYRE